MLQQISDNQAEQNQDLGILPKQFIDKNLKVLLRKKQKQINYLPSGSQKGLQCNSSLQPAIDKIRSEVLKQKEKAVELEIKTQLDSKANKFMPPS